MATPKVPYRGSYKGRHVDVEAVSPMAAQQEAGRRLEVPASKQYLIAVRRTPIVEKLCELEL